MNSTCTGLPNCFCGCCAGTGVQTPQSKFNLPGLPSIAYRAGTWATFKESMLARLSSSDYPALAALKTRENDDFTIAFLDAAAIMLDILTFYQERLASEGYLRTAVQLRSLIELSRLIGYQPSPGVSAAVYVAFTLKPGPPIVIPKGTQVQSVPAQGQKPQTFETSADIPANADWNALAVQSDTPWVPPGGNSLYLAGTSTQLKTGDSLLILGPDREQWTPPPPPPIFTTGIGVFVEARAFLPQSPPDQWEVVVLNSVQVDNVRKLTYVGWDQPLSHTSGTQTPGPWKAAKVFAFRQKASLFGHNAPDPKLFVNNNVSPPAPAFPDLIDVLPPPTIGGFILFRIISSTWKWHGFQITSSNQIDLDATYPKIVVGSWFALTSGGQAQLYKVVNAASVSLSKFTLSGKVTELAADFNDPNLSAFTLPLTDVWAQSEELTVANQPLDDPLCGKVVDLEDLRTDLAGLQSVAVNGSALSEIAPVASVTNVTTPYPHTQIELQSNLVNCYDRFTTTMNANVGLATQGQSVSEIVGSGNASTPNQTFNLKQPPLTFTQAPTPTGRQSTLQVRVNGVAWTEVPTLYQQGPSQQVYATLNQPGGGTTVRFGDGLEGATLPTGQNNVQANYRVGLGSSGNVAAGTLTTLLDRPLGVSGVINPQAATGGQDADSIDDIRSNAPQTVLTLGRAVSIADYETFASSFAGIEKAHALWIPDGPGRGVFLTVAGVGGASLPPGNPTLNNLIAALQNYGNPLIPITAVSFQQTLFSLAADIAYDPRYDTSAVQAQVRQALAAAYSFEARDFGEAISVDESAAIIQNVAGVVAVNVSRLSTPTDSSSTQICAFLPIANVISLPQPGEILVLNPDPAQVVLGTMS